MPVTKQAQATAGVEAGVDAALKRFIHAAINRQHTNYYDMLSNKDRAAKSREKYLQEQQQLQPNLADAYFERITYKITAITVNGTAAKVEAIYQFPDVESMIKKVYNLSVLDQQALPPLNAMKQKLDNAYAGKVLPMKAVTHHFNLIQENNDWHVYIEWDKAQ